MKEKRRNGLHIIAVIGFALLMAIPVSITAAPSNATVATANTGISHETGTILNVNGYKVNSNSLSGLPDDLVINHYQYGRGAYIIVFDRPVTSQMKTNVKAAGADILASLGHRQFIAEISDSDLANVRAQPHVKAVVIDQPAFRLSRFLDNVKGPVKVDIYAFPGYDKSVVSSLTKLLYPNHMGWITSLAPSGDIFVDHISLLDKEYGMVTATVYPGVLHDIAKINGVSYVDISVPHYIFNDESHSQTQNNHNDTTSVGAPDNLAAGQANGGTTNVWNHGIYGTGVIIGETDTGIGVHHDLFRDPNNPYYNNASAGTPVIPTNTYMPDQRKVVMYATYAITGYDHNMSEEDPDHGSHVAGTIVGYDNPVSGTSVYDGMAPGAKIALGDIHTPGDGNSLRVPENYATLWNPLMTGNLSMVRICSHSWGGHVADSSGNPTEQPSYMGENAQIDEYQWKNDKLFAWAAGNEGGGSGFFPSPTPHTLGIEAESKNTVTVAAADRTDKMASFSSIGPTFDNRLKPDVTMAGTNINSAEANKGDDQYTAISGTSMATPGVAGTIGLIQDYFEKGFYPSGSKVSGHEREPSAALMKAEIINGAEEMSDSSAHNNPYNGNDGYPSCNQGWGFINVDKSLYLGPSDPRKVRVWDSGFGISTGENISLNFNVSDTSVPFTVTLVWTDPPAAQGASTALINDIDLTVIAPNGDEYKGNIFNGTNPGHSVTGGDYDRLNNVEEVKLVSGHGLSTGIWQVRISGYDIEIEPQPFALVVSGGLNLNSGFVYLDRDIYCENATAHISVEDADGVSPVPVTVTSALTGDSEIVNCTGNNSLFTGSIQFTLDDPVANDGKLSVKGDDTMTVAYNPDDDKSFTSTAVARIDAKPPVITNPHVEYKSNVMAKIGLTTDEKAFASIHYGTDPNNMTSTDFTSTYSTTPEIALTGLKENTLYYYDVVAKDCCGHTTLDNNGGNHYRFTTDKQGDILLLVSDNQGYDWQQLIREYTDAMNDKQWTFNFWYSWDQGTPPLTTLQKYKAVSWQVGIEHYAPFDAGERAVVKEYLDNGGRLWVNSQDVAWAFGDSSSNPFYSDEVHNWLLSQMKEDWKQDKDIDKIKTADSSDPISGAYTSDIPYDKYRAGGSGDDIKSNAAGGTTTYVWYDDTNGDNCGVKWVSSANNGTSGTGVWGGTPSKIVVDNFEWTALDNRSIVHSDTRSDIADKTLIWLIGHDHPDVNVSNPSTGDTITTNTLTIRWNKTTYGGSGVYNTTIYYSNNSGDAWYPIDTVGDATSYNWDISSIPNGLHYKIKVEVYDDSSIHLMGANVTGEFEISRSGGDTQGPVIVAGTPSVDPVPVHYNTTMWINATADDSNRGGTDIYDVVFYIDSTSGTSTHMNPVDGAFDSPTENVTWSGTCNLAHGDHTVYIKAEDKAGNWGDFANISFHVNGPEAVTVNVTQGWNFISLPWLNTPTNISNALSNISWTRAMIYQNGVWHTYNKNRADKFNLGFPDVDNTMGMWVYATAAGNEKGFGSGSTTTHLYPGWNLVGYANSTIQPVSDALNGISYDYLQTYDSASGKMVTLSTSDNMVPGQAYWIYVETGQDWTVSW